MSHWTFKRPANKKKCIFSDFHSWLKSASKAKPSGFKYIRQNITAFDLKTFLLLRLAGGVKKAWMAVFIFFHDFKPVSSTNGVGRLWRTTSSRER